MPEKELTHDDKRALLTLAREQIKHIVAQDHPPEYPEGESLLQPAGAFVSLHKKGALRGCIGTFDTTRPIRQQVRSMAAAAATEDPRFSTVTPEEIPDLDIEISVLTPPKPIKDLSEIEVGTHGLVVSQGYRRGVLLPQVASEHGWDRETFLSHTCLKAGLPAEAWKESKARVEVFTALVFGEEE